VAAPIWLRHEASFAHDIPGHPERPARLLAVERAMSEAGWFGCALTEAPEVARRQLLEVHSAEHVDLLEALCARGGGRIDMDTSAVQATWPAALRAAGGAIALATALLEGSAPVGVSALRPPGHHAERAQAMGFCFFNNIAVAAAHAVRELGAERVLILDWDVHHGNGTNEIFHASDEVLFVSIHESPLYPGTGPASDVGRGDGTGYTVNLPVPAGSGDETFCSLVEHVVVPLAHEYQPSLVLVSAGFDAHELDPLASCRVTAGGFAAMTGSLRRVCAELEVPMGMVLEGGYSLDALAISMSALMPVLVAPDPPPAADVDLDVHPLAAEAGRRLERYFGSIFLA
jgi:acetoin utilization deacetylase AcuC-like enzyme